jgi:hypothetical protein
MTVGGSCFFGSISKENVDETEEGLSVKTKKKQKSLRKRISLVWKKHFLGGTEDETRCLLKEDKCTTRARTLSINASDSISGKDIEKNSSSQQKPKKKRTVMKRIGKAALTTCRYIGIGAQSLSAPGMLPHHYVPYNFHDVSYNRRGAFTFEYPNDLCYYSCPPTYLP